MKSLLTLMLFFAAFKGFAQSDVIVEEKASDWIKITATTDTPKPKTTTTVKKKNTTNKPTTPKQDAQQEFEKTNSQVNRFKKQQKN